MNTHCHASLDTGWKMNGCGYEKAERYREKRGGDASRIMPAHEITVGTCSLDHNGLYGVRKSRGNNFSMPIASMKMHQIMRKCVNACQYMRTAVDRHLLRHAGTKSRLWRSKSGYQS